MPARPLNVVVCEHNILMATLYQVAFQEMGHAVLLARSGFEALSMARTQTVDLLVASLGGVGAPGILTVLEIRKILPDVAVLICSGYSKPENLRDMVRPPMAFLEKPFGLDRLTCAVRQLAVQIENGRRGRESAAIG